jgi:hypothetical protein
MPKKPEEDDDEIIHCGGTPEEFDAAFERAYQRLKRKTAQPVDKAHGRIRPKSQARC